MSRIPRGSDTTPARTREMLLCPSCSKLMRPLTIRNRHIDSYEHWYACDDCGLGMPAIIHYHMDHSMLLRIARVLSKVHSSMGTIREMLRVASVVYLNNHPLIDIVKNITTASGEEAWMKLAINKINSELGESGTIFGLTESQITEIMRGDAEQ